MRDNADDVVTRRQLLAGASGVGLLGTIGGASTHALLADSNRFSSKSLETGEIDLTADCDRCQQTDDAVAFSFADIEPGDSGRSTIELAVGANPVRLWMRTDCPSQVDPLAAVLEVDLRLDADCDGGRDGDRNGDDPLLFSGTLAEFRREFAGGRRLERGPSGGTRVDTDDACLSGNEPLCLEIGWRFPAEDVEGLVGLSSALRFEFHAEQCRHVDERDATNPFDGLDCPEPECAECLRLGTAEIAGDSIDPGDVFTLDTVDGAFDEYALEALSVTNVSDGETVCASFRLLRDGSEDRAPPMCSLETAGGEETAIEPPSTRTSGEVCTKATVRGRRGTSIRPALDTVTVSVCPLEECTVCGEGEGAVRRLTLEYVGEENPDGDERTIAVSGRGGPNCGALTDVSATPGTVFDVDATAAGTDRLCATTVLEVSGPDGSDAYEVHTSCSKPLGPGTAVRDADGRVVFRVVSGTTPSGVELCTGGNQ